VDILSAQKAWTWFEAQQLCEQNNDSLPSHLTFRSQNLSAQEYWLGRYRRSSFWIKILGIFDI
jgi:hypothetical protein